MIKSTNHNEYTLIIDDLTALTPSGVTALDKLRNHFHIIAAASDQNDTLQLSEQFSEHMQKGLLLALCLSITAHVHAQNITLPDILSLEASLTRFHEIERAAQLKAFDQTKSADWKDLLPSVGVAYTPSGAPRPAASWSPLQILDRKEKERKRKLDRQSLILNFEILLTDRLYKLRQLYHDYQIDQQALITTMETIEIDEKLFAITEQKYQENIIKPSEYLTSKKSMLQTRSAVQAAKQELYNKKNEILYVAKWE